MPDQPNISLITPPRVAMIDERTGAVSREWYRWFYNLYYATGGTNNGAVPVDRGGTGTTTIPTDGQLLIGNTTTGAYTVAELGTGDGIDKTIGPGILSIENTGVLSFNAGTTGFSPSDSTNGNVTLDGTLNTAHGGTGQTSYTNGQLLIGNTTGNTLTKSTLTAGSGVTITNGPGSISISATGSGGDVVGPSSATDNAIVRFDGTTGKLIQNSPVTIDDAGNIVSPDSIKFSGTPPVTQPVGTLWFDSSTDTLNLQQNAITQQIGEEIYVYGKASAAISGETILQAIYKTGVVGASGNITFAPTVAGITDTGAIIGVATEDIATNSFGRITSFGIVHGINTTGSTYGETWVDGQDIWYNPVTGGLTKNKPSAPNQKFQIGTVINAGPGGSGSFQVLLQPGSVLGGTDSNVQFGTLANNDLIVYSTSSQYWTNAAQSTITAGKATNLAGGAANRIPYQTGADTTSFIAAPTIANTFLEWSGSAYQWSANPLGTVTSVTGTAPVSVANSTTTPVVSLASGYGDTQNPYASKTANYFLAAPNGSSGVPTFRAMVAADVPTLNQDTTGTAAKADTVKTVSTATNADFYLTFVDSNNGTAAYEAVYTDAGITYNPSTNAITSGISGGTF